MKGSEGLLHETIAPRSRLPPLLAKLDEQPPECVDYIGVAYGLTAQLYRCVIHQLTISFHNFPHPISLLLHVQVLEESWFRSSVHTADCCELCAGLVSCVPTEMAV